MDDLDRLYLELVEILRGEQPGALGQSVRVLDLHEQLIPYRRVRNRVGFASNDDYEIALTRLLSGERGYLEADRDMQQELTAGLAETLPDARRYLAFSETRVMLSAGKIPPPGDTRYAPPELQQIGGREEQDEGRAEPGSVEDAEAEQPEAVATPNREAAVDERRDLPAACPRCNGGVPDAATYCPYCGCRLLPDNCRVCGAELDSTWWFCARCGSRRGEEGGNSA
jgi:hypothetical protein